MLRRRRALTPEEIDQRAREAEVAPAGIAARISKLVIGRKAGEGRSTARASRSVAERVEPEPGPPDDELSDAEVARLELEYRSLPKPRPPRTFDPGAARDCSAEELRAAAGSVAAPSPREARQAARAERAEQARNAAAARAAEAAAAAGAMPEGAGATAARRIPTRVIHTPQEVRDRYHLPPAPNSEPHHD